VDVTRNGCPGQGTRLLTVNENPLVSVSGSDPVSPGSAGNVYSAAVLPAGGTVTYGWLISGNGSIVGLSTGSTVSVTAGATGSFMLTLNATRNGCPGQGQKTVTVGASTVAAVIQAADTTFTPPLVTISQGQQVRWEWVNGFHTTTSGLSSNLPDNPGLLWDVTVDSGHPEFTYQFDDLGYFPYFCRVHEAMGMKGAVVVQDSSVIAVGEEPRAGNSIRFRASPNPFSRSVLLQFELPREMRVGIDVFDLEGRHVLNLLLTGLPAGGHRVYWGGWDESHMPVSDGIYFARLLGDDGTVIVRKLLKTD
jgi:plastocyanin